MLLQNVGRLLTTRHYMLALRWLVSWLVSQSVMYSDLRGMCVPRECIAATNPSILSEKGKVR
jgi:hypothetical protein